MGEGADREVEKDHAESEADGHEEGEEGGGLSCVQGGVGDERGDGGGDGDEGEEDEEGVDRGCCDAFDAAWER